MNNKQTTNIKNYFFFIIVYFSVMVIYEIVSYLTFPHLHMRITPSFLLVEIPITLVLINIFYLPHLKSRVVKYLFPLIPLFSLYISFDIFYSYLQKSPRLSDFDNLTTIYNFFPKMFFGIMLSIFLIILIISLVFLYSKKFYKAKAFRNTIIARVSILLFLIIFLQTDTFISYQNKTFEFARWSNKRTIHDNGKISSFIYYSNLESRNRKILEQQGSNKININKTLYPYNLVDRPNIYMVVLESFINPNYLKYIQYDKNPLSIKLEKHLYNQKFSRIISPVYGGRTAQAEFELLTGIKAFAKVGSIEFNILEGGAVNSFLHQLRANGYKTNATIATESSYFNSKIAYKSLGFEQVTYLEEEKNFKRDNEDIMIFDGDLFNYNINKVKEQLANSKQPFFNYLLGVYGHMPFYRNIKKRPDIIEPINVKNELVKKLANQFYYRTDALAKYIDKILEIDSNAIIIISSDHLPPSLLNDAIQYKYELKVNIALLINKGQAIDISGKKQYEIPWLIWDTLSNRQNSRNLDSKILEQLYYKALYRGIQK